LSFTLAELAREVGAELKGPGECGIDGIATLTAAGPGEISFLANPRYRKFLGRTRASGVILKPEDLPLCTVSALVTDNPYLAYARIAGMLFPEPPVKAGRHRTAVVASSARVSDSAWIGPGSIIGDDVVIGSGVCVGPACVIENGCSVGAGSRLVARVTLCHGTVIGERAIVHPGAVIGSDGFGLASDEGIWVKVPQLGKVRVGNDVEIGANTTIDRGALGDTVIHDGVKLDNQIQIAHNVEIGEHTAIAACVGVSGSTRIGRHCTLGGGVGLAGHLEFADNVHFTGQSLVTRSFLKPGYYSGNLPAAPNREWKRSIARFRRIDEMWQRIKELERRVLGNKGRVGEKLNDDS